MQAKKLKILRNTLGSYRRERDEFLFYCPKCEHHKSKFSINLQKDCYKCWCCDYSGRQLGRLVRKHGSFTDYKAWGEFKEKVNISDFELLFAEMEMDDEPEALELPQEFISLANKKLPLASLPAQQYLRNRSVSKGDICYWRMGFCGAGEYEGYIVIPSFDLKGEVNFFVARSYNGSWMKYKNPRVERNKVIFNELFLNFQEELTIVEGIFDAVVAGQNSVPLLGSTISEKSKLLKSIVMNDTPVYLALDADAGKKTMVIVDKLLQYGIDVYRVDTSGYDDVGTMTRNEFDRRKSEAVKMTHDGCLLYRALSV